MAQEAPKRPARVEHIKQAAGPRKRMRDVKHNMPKHYHESISKNAKLKACCREVDTSMVQFYRTHPEAFQPDLMIVECDCGKKQYRMAAGANKIAS